jgi:hypothetical protein
MVGFINWTRSGLTFPQASAKSRCEPAAWAMMAQRARQLPPDVTGVETVIIHGAAVPAPQPHPACHEPLKLRWVATCEVAQPPLPLAAPTTAYQLLCHVMSGVLVMRGRCDAMRCITCRAVNAGNRARISPASPRSPAASTPSRFPSPTGRWNNHTQRQWLHDVAIFELLSTSAIHSLVGLPITFVTVERAVSR